MQIDKMKKNRKLMRWDCNYISCRSCFINWMSPADNFPLLGTSDDEDDDDDDG